MSEKNGDIEDKSPNASEEHEMQQLRKLLLGDNSQLVRDVIKEESRELVSNVLTEALHDRQKLDGSVSGILAPLVEKSVETSVVARKKQFVSYLYPLVGGLVRKAVSTSLAEIVEKTNELLESSFTYKGLRWRFEARRAGISYSQYVVQQTFEYRVEQVLLIHRETGLLLRTIIHDSTQATDGDLFSGMLTAINDFISDSFSKEGGEQNLDEIKTDDFTLLIKQGPKAILVAAITGNAPANIADKLQFTLETIHQIYNDELNAFDGDASVFENADQQLNTCLLSQQKTEEKVRKKKPWLAITVLMIGVVFSSYFFAKAWHLNHIAEKLSVLPNAPGLILLGVERCGDNVCLDILRDPLAQTTEQWMSTVLSSQDLVRVNEQAYRSLDITLFPRRLLGIHQDFPELTYNESESKFSGLITKQRFEQLSLRLNAMPELAQVEVSLRDVKIIKTELDEYLVSQFLLEQKIADIKDIYLDFEIAKSDLSDATLSSIKLLSEKILDANTLASKLEQSFLLLIMAVSTDSGSVDYNQQLNFKRVKEVERMLVEHGIPSSFFKSVDVGSISNKIPQVVFEVISLPLENSEIVRD